MRSYKDIEPRARDTWFDFVVEQSQKRRDIKMKTTVVQIVPYMAYVWERQQLSIT
jgi:hypothetical protein